MLSKLIKIFYQKLKKIYYLISWQIDSKKLRKDIEAIQPPIPQNNLNGKILILAPHSDDEWIGCSQLIETSDCIIYHMDMLGDNDENTRKIRLIETQNLANRYNKELIISQGNKIEFLHRTITLTQPQYIALPFYIDWHPEHLQTIQILKEAIGNYNCNIIMYQITCPIPSTMVNYAIPLNKSQWRKKWYIFKNIYKSQKYFPWYRLALIEKSAGAYTKSYSANVFCIMQRQNWLDLFYLLPTDEISKKLKNNINQIYNNNVFIETLCLKQPKNRLGLIPLLYDEINFGGVLQFYALQKILNKSGYDTDIIFIKDNKKFMNKYKKESKVKKIYHFLLLPYILIKQHINHTTISKLLCERIIKTNIFKEKYYSKTIKFKSSIANNYIAFICGSDQIWNPNFTREKYFLNFVPNDINKIIYAASMGHENLSKQQEELFRKYTKNLKHISVREDTAQKLLKTVLNRDDINLVLDPTLLLTKQDWEEICNINSVPKEKYILTYFLGECSKIKDHIIKFAKQKSLKIANIPYASGERIDREKFGDINLINTSPDEFLGLIKNSEYIFTDSFHACIFSIIYEKQFFVTVRNGKSNMMNRIYNLLKITGINNRIIPITPIIDYTPIDYLHTKEKIAPFKSYSLNFLFNSINSK